MAFSLWNWACDQLKPKAGQRKTFKNTSPQLVVHLSPRYNQVTVVSGNPFWQLQIDYSMDVHKDVHYQVKHRLYMTWTDTYIVSNARSLLKKTVNQSARTIVAI